MIVELVSVGTELLLGQVVNTNAAVIGQRLADAGLDHYLQTAAGDNLARLTVTIRSALGRSDAVIITGGLGPTPDDLTREAIAAATGRALVFNQGWAEELRQRFRSLSREMPESNLRQAQYSLGAELIPNPKGTAPGISLRTDGKWLFALPGVPEEMLPMLEDHVVPTLVEAAGEGATLVSRVLRSWGLSEAQLAEQLDDLFHASANPSLAFLASAGEIQVRLSAKAADRTSALSLLEPLEMEVRQRLGPAVFGSDHQTVESVVLELLAERGWGLGLAESATGGLLAARLSAVPGASRVLRGGVVAYTPELKRELLGVSELTMAGNGVVSEPTALEMAEGAAARLGAEVTVAVTGSAGPEPLEDEPGTMVVAVRSPEGARARTMRLPGDRKRVRVYTTTAALHLTRLAVLGEWW